MRRIVCLGDSLTSGHGIGTAAAYPALLHQRVRRAGFPFEVVNAGVARATSTDAHARIERALEGDVRVLVVALGANDGLRGVPVAQLKANLARIIDFQGAARQEAAIVDGEHYGFEERTKRGVERAVDENVVVVLNHAQETHPSR